MSQTSLKTRMLEAFRARMYFYLAIIATVFLILILQLINLQLLQGSEYRKKSRLNMENNIPIPASRGEIYDRYFDNIDRRKVVVSNRPSFNLSAIPSRFSDKKSFYKTMDNLARLLKIDKDLILKEVKGHNPWERITLVEDVSFDAIVRIASHRSLFPFIDWEDAPVRVYTHKEMFAHAIGYIGSINKDEYRKRRHTGYKHYQKVGKTGIEKQYDRILRGQDGYIRRIVDVKNRTEGEEIGLRPVAGNNLVLTMDFGVQKADSEALGGSRGAVVVIKPSTGEVIALVSKPDFDPNQIINKDNAKIFRELYADKNRPFLNRVIQSKYPPASTFKLVTAIAALETEKSYPSKRFYCPGKYTLKGYRDKDFYCYQTHGSLDLYHAIGKSCSVYFYNLGYKVGPTSILKYADYFGLNQKSGIDLPGEKASFIPSKKWKLRTFGQPWFDGDTINLSIGQGFLNVTPIGMANFVAGIVNNGIVYRPHLLKEVRSPDNSRILSVTKKEKIREIPLSPLSLIAVKQGMRLSVTGGTSAGLRHLKVQLAGKTGTAQTRSRRKEDSTQHAWFVGYGPYNSTPDEAIVIAVIVEYGVAGAATAVPVAEKVFQALYKQRFFNVQ